MSVYFKNRLRGYSVVIPTLQALSKDICRGCIGLEGAKTKVIKGLKKLKIDLEDSDLSQKEEIIMSINNLLDIAEMIDVEETTTCQKTTGKCRIGPSCLALDGALGLMKEITEPVTAKPETTVKVVDVRAACCLDTLSAPIKDAMKDIKSGEVLEVIAAERLKSIFNKFIEQERYVIIEEKGVGEEVRYKIRLK